MIAALAARLIASGVPAKLARPLIYLIGGLLLCGLLWAIWSLWLADHDSDVIERDRLKGNLEAVKGKSEADTNAADARLHDMVRIERERAQLEKVTSDETLSAAERRRAYYDELRRQQADRSSASARR